MTFELISVFYSSFLFSRQLWYLLMIAFLGRKPHKAGKYADFLPSYPVPPLKSTCKK